MKKAGSNKELMRFSAASIILSSIGLLVFWWLGSVGIILGIRGLILQSPDTHNIKIYKSMSVVGILIGIFDIVLYNIVA